MDNNVNDSTVKNSFGSAPTKGLGFGVLLMLVGIVFLGLNFGLIPRKLGHVLFSWPMLLIVIGIGKFIKTRFQSGTILLLIGSFFIIPRFIEAFPTFFPGINGNFTQVYWPLLLIAAGILIISGKLFGQKLGWNDWASEWQNRQQRHHHRHNRSHHAQWNLHPDGFTKNSVFGSGDHIVLDPEFKGGEMNAVFGGITLDLRRTNLPEGETYLDINAVFGGITIYVPSEWNVVTHLDAVFGGFQDNRRPIEPADKNKKLIITGSCVFGGGELRN